LGSKISKQEVPLKLDDDWVEELVNYDGGGSSLKVVTKIGKEVGVEIKDVKEEAAHEVALAKRQWPRQKLQRR
jgi:hypothetical protein